ncbi:hypothetical protein MMC26_003946 [Xylographa opegraphella]|nr:hypothetical protein [Xylographa opegraphella]
MWMEGGNRRRLGLCDNESREIGKERPDPMASKWSRYEAEDNDYLEDNVNGEENDSLDLEEEQGWEDVEPDVEKVVYKSLFDEKKFQDVHSMLQYCLATYHFDFIGLRVELRLDFLESIKLVNYIRAEVIRGNTTLKITSKQTFNDDKYLQPVLEDDALLFSLDDLETSNELFDSQQRSSSNTKENQIPADEMVNLRRKLQRTVDAVKDRFRYMRTQLKMRTVFQADPDPFRSFSDPGIPVLSSLHRPSLSTIGNFRSHTDQVSVSGWRSLNSSSRSNRLDDDEHYKQAYSGIDIHETMIKDAVRTNAYKDFIYNNAHLFEGKTVMDVGCGSGILSLFCAKAGAKTVYAVDQSDIIYKAMEVVHDCKLSDIIKFRHGSIEQMTEWDIPKVDIIVSEWMGYALLYESMLDSVILARDRFLKPNGIVLPSHASLFIAPLHDPQYHAQKVDFWSDVHGFNMSAMAKQAYRDAIVRTVGPPTIIGKEYKFLELDLRTCRKIDLEFYAYYNCKLKDGSASLSGFAVWFDVVFAPPGGSKSETMTTSPFQPVTHWEQAYLMINPECKGKTLSGGLPVGTELRGTVRYAKREDNEREVDIRVKWEAYGHELGEEEEEVGEQEWAMR